ncbi:arginine--tRNA ligase [Taibaiella sp. KBW10]|uniref:arginine--tRNA ligase n=1 Tax=Taibaiella sp. KBW10 TaxID=2153357 RepID=UPI000F5ABCC9|nr:arginine--tRNA ligase [Taibaiella sp. KBW10]RQO31882.1 arginine--tRNA ligase [Taibaiella sp. KBW10]
MKSLAEQVKVSAAKAFQSLFPEANVQENDILVNETKPEFKGDYTIVLFPFVKSLRQNPVALGNALGAWLVDNNELFTAHETVSGFLNLSVSDAYWSTFLSDYTLDTDTKDTSLSDKKVMVEYSSPNTNKPLHLGHLRNNFLGNAVAGIVAAAGAEVTKTCVVNDRGVHICKSMIAWQLFANGATPQSEGIKGDHFVGDYYVQFNDEYKRQIKELVAGGMEEKQAEQEAPIMKATQQMLVDWEAGKPEVMSLWNTMNSWVYEGFDTTYKAIGSTFDKIYYESNTYLLGKDLVEEGLAKGVFYQKEDGSVWIDLTTDGLDEKLVRRKDGTSVYITQDIGLAVEKQKEYGIEESIYVVGDEQNYHFKVLKLICQKLGLPAADGIYHLSYGMVELPTGKMKSREGTVVDADDLVAEMVRLAQEQTEAAGKTEGFSTEELAALYEMIGLGALKFYLLRVEPKKKMIFNPEESIDLHGFTATFIQYAHARICSVLRKTGYQATTVALDTHDIFPEEKALLVQLEQYPAILQQAAAELNPAALCNYSFKLAQAFNSFYDKCSIANAESAAKKQLRSEIASLTAKTLKHGLGLLGIGVPEKM